MNRSLWNCLAGGGDGLQFAVSVFIVVRVDSVHLTQYMERRGEGYPPLMARWCYTQVRRKRSILHQALAKGGCDKTVGKPSTVIGLVDHWPWKRGEGTATDWVPRGHPSAFGHGG